ncbi:MAG TPA: hypothetical protein VKM55_15715 [Candidatus Lokiarchaeia archaeon]|nr:hypothetical protein [Candidatus Lokiarchaeia archaeon]
MQKNYDLRKKKDSPTGIVIKSKSDHGFVLSDEAIGNFVYLLVALVNNQLIDPESKDPK